MKREPFVMLPRNIFAYRLSFDDAQAVISEKGFFREREMILEGKPFKIRSFFRPVSSETATDKLLRLIDKELPEKNR